MNRGCFIECPRCEGRGFSSDPSEDGRTYRDCPVCWSEGFDGCEPVGHIALPIAPSIANDPEKATWVDMFLADDFELSIDDLIYMRDWERLAARMHDT